MCPSTVTRSVPNDKEYGIEDLIEDEIDADWDKLCEENQIVEEFNSISGLRLNLFKIFDNLHAAE